MKSSMQSLKKVYDNRVVKEDHWNALKISGMRGQLPYEIETFYRETSTHVKVDRETSDSFAIKVRVQQNDTMIISYFFTRYIKKISSLDFSCVKQIKLKGNMVWYLNVGNPNVLM